MKIRKSYFRRNMIVYGSALIAVGNSLIAAGSAPTIDPSGTEKVVLVSDTKLTLTASGGEAPEPSTQATCPPWAKDGGLTYTWSNGTQGKSLEVDISSSGDKGSFKVAGKNQKWKDKKGNAGAETSTPDSSSIKIVAVKVELETEKQEVGDGSSVTIQLVINPQSAKDKITDAEMKVEPVVTPTKFRDEPTSTATMVNNDLLKWKISKAVWFAQGNGCNLTALYFVIYKCKVGGTEIRQIFMELHVRALEPCGQSLGGYTYFTGNAFTGQPTINAYWDATNNKFVSKYAGIGSFKRAVVADKQICQPSGSQYYDWIVAEETFHIKQFQGDLGGDTDALNPLRNYFLADFFYDTEKSTTISQSWTGSSPPDATEQGIGIQDVKKQLLAKWNKQLETYLNSQADEANSHLNSVRNQVEQAAKVGKTYLGSYECYLENKNLR